MTVIAGAIFTLFARIRLELAAVTLDSVTPLTEAQRRELRPNIVRVMLAALLEAQAR